MDQLTFGDSFGNSLGDVLDDNVLDGDVSDNEIYVPLSVNSSLPAQPRNLDMESVVNFNAMRLSALPESNTDKPQPYTQ